MVEFTDASGNILETIYGPSQEELKQEHDEGRCGAFCGYCYHAACVYHAACDKFHDNLYNPINPLCVDWALKIWENNP